MLPTSRSVQVGTPATAFATIVNAGPGDATTCTISPQTGQPASFVFQTTDPNTNSLTGTANTPADIPQGGSQSFVFAFTPNAPFGSREIALVYSCANGPRPATTMVGLNTLNLSASPVPVPDIVAVLASTDPGYVIITPTTNTGVFAVAASNVGIADTITASVDSGTANLPVTFTICQADFASRACVAAPAATVTLPIGAGGTAGFGIFLRASARVPDMPATNRAFVRFTNSTGTLRGAASVAVRTGGGGGGGGDGGTASARPRLELLRRGPLKLLRGWREIVFAREPGQRGGHRRQCIDGRGRRAARRPGSTAPPRRLTSANPSSSVVSSPRNTGRRPWNGGSAINAAIAPSLP